MLDPMNPARGGLVLLASEVLDVTLTGTVAETELFRRTIPAGLVQPGGGVHVVVEWLHTAGVGNDLARARLDQAGNLSLGSQLSFSTQTWGRAWASFWAMGATGVTTASNGNTTFGVGGTSFSVQPAIDWSEPVDILFAGVLNDPGNVLTLARVLAFASTGRGID